jgi:mannose-6-phosphate isomerase-like protein (cupin superfamily)
MFSLHHNPLDMKALLIPIVFTFIALNSISQNVTNIEGFQPRLNYENIHVYELDSDPNASSFLIWVKQAVAPHKHEHHTELVYVLQGEGIFTFHLEGGEEKSSTIGAGDYIFIPKGMAHSVKVTNDSPMKVLSVQTPQFDGSDRVMMAE